MTTAHGFPPLAQVDAAILVLGTMPGKVSLRRGQYYAHGRNTFWKLLASILGFDEKDSYEKRVNHVAVARVAVWDVLRLCTRESSLDSDIVDPVANDFVAFFAAHSEIKRVCFNGAKAESLYRSHVLKMVTKPLEYVCLPSTSPANASTTFDRKRAAWSAALQL